MNSHFEYDAEVANIVDGDTVDLCVDLGFDVWVNMRVRLYGINAPELWTAEGKVARQWLVDKLHTMKMCVTLESIKDRREKYGRYLAVLKDGDGPSVNQQMVAAGHAVPYMIN